MHLLDVISESMEEYVEIVNADFWQVQECFKEIMDCFIFKNCIKNTLYQGIGI